LRGSGYLGKNTGASMRVCFSTLLFKFSHLY
jgi:hypothetical protein